LPLHVIVTITIIINYYYHMTVCINNGENNFVVMDSDGNDVDWFRQI